MCWNLIFFDVISYHSLVFPSCFSTPLNLVMISLNKNVPKVNPFTAKPFSARFQTILQKRLLLPVWEYGEEFVKLVTKNQVLVLVGETGSGKTTQVNLFLLLKRLFVSNDAHEFVLLIYPLKYYKLLLLISFS